MGFTLTDVLLFGKAQSSDVDSAAFAIMRRNILRWGAIGGYVSIVVHGVSPLVLPDAIANSLSYVKAFGGTEQRNIPDGYTQLEYIESTGTQLIDLGLKWTYGTSTKTVCEMLNRESVALGCVAARNSSSIVWGNFQNNANANYTCFGDVVNVQFSQNMADGNYHTWETNNAGFYLDGVQKTDLSGSDQTLVSTDNIGLFGRYDGAGIIERCGKWRIKSHQTSVDNTLVQDLIPVKRNSDNVLGMFDLVSGQFLTNQGTGSFIAGPEVVPTPNAPIDIVSNNGVLKARHQSGLPLGYTLLEYIESTGTQYIDTGLKLTQDNTVEVEYNYHTASNIATSGRMFGARYTSSPRRSFSLGSNSGYASSAAKTFAQFGSADRLATNNITFGQWGVYKMSADGFYIDGVLQGSFPATTFETPFTVKLFAFEQASSSSGTPTVGCGVGRCRRFKVYQGDTLVMDLISAKNPTDDIGMYDLVSGQFFTNQGTGDFVAGATVDDIEVYADGTVETINVHGKNLFDKNSYTEINAYVNANTGVLTQGSPGANTQYCAVIPCKPNTTYTISGRSSSAWGAFASSNIGTTATSYNKTVNGSITTGANDIYLIGLVRANSDTVDYRDVLQVELGSTATAYQPYYDGGTATAEMLLKVGDYQDEQEILSGVVTRNVGVKALNGTENFETATATNCYSLTNTLGTGNFADRTIVCSHFANTPTLPGTGDRQGLAFIVNKGPEYTIAFGATTQFSTQALWKQFLADQYAAGTPVIVLYPLATPTTESVAGQTLQVQAGDNVLEITQASLSGLELEAQYNAAVSLTIQEVEDANLDNNVTVTIQ